MTPTEKILSARYQIAREGGLVDAIKQATDGTNWHPAQLLAVGSRETGFLWGSHYGKFHDWAILGDAGHGHGVFQIDDRSHGQWLLSAPGAWKDPLAGAQQATKILEDGYNALLKLAGPDAVAPVAIWHETVFAAYNCGPGNAWKGYKNHNDPSIFTTGHDYGKDVLSQVEIFGRLMEGA